MRFLGVAAIVAAALIPSAAAGANPAVALGVSPLRLELKGAATQSITVRNPGAKALIVTVTRAGFARTLHGKPRIESTRGAATWLRITPRRVRLAPHATTQLKIGARIPARATPGDHPALVLLATHPPATKKVRVLLRVGVVVLVRVPGTIVHWLVAQKLSVQKQDTTRVLSLRIANRGNVAERIDGARLELVLSQGGKRFARLRARRLDLLPHSVGIAEFTYRGAVRGRILARVRLRPVKDGPSRSFAVRLP